MERMENTDNEFSQRELEALIAQVEAEELLRAPAHFKERVMERSRQADVQLIVRTQKISRKLVFFCYSLKIGAAAALALFALFWMPRELFPRPDAWDTPAAEYGILNGEWEESRQSLAEKMEESAEKMLTQFTDAAVSWINKED